MLKSIKSDYIPEQSKSIKKYLKEFLEKLQMYLSIAEINEKKDSKEIKFLKKNEEKISKILTKKNEEKNEKNH